MKSTKMKIKTLTSTSILSFFFSTFFLLNFSYSGSKRTYPVPEYIADPAADLMFEAEGEFEDSKAYSDPDFAIAENLPSPLEEPRFNSYNLIIIVNQNEVNKGLPNYEPAQTMRVYSRGDSSLLYFWKVSTARSGKQTPNGYFRIQHFSSAHESSLYQNAKMPWAVFFNGDIATHAATGAGVRNLGSRASAGCVRLENQRARELFHMFGNSGSGYVDEIGPSGLPIFDSNDAPKKVWGYKSLVIVKSQEQY